MENATARHIAQELHRLMMTRGIYELPRKRATIDASTQHNGFVVRVWEEDLQHYWTVNLRSVTGSVINAVRTKR